MYAHSEPDKPIGGYREPPKQAKIRVGSMLSAARERKLESVGEISRKLMGFEGVKLTRKRNPPPTNTQM